MAKPILIIGERVLNRNLTLARVRAWEILWRDHKWAAARRTPGLGGNSGSRLDRLLGGVAQERINLLPPDRASGSWDGELAWEVAADLLYRLGSGDEKDCWSGVVLLGRRVADTMMTHHDPIAFCQIREVLGIPWLCLPHPSGRNGWWTDSNTRIAKSAIKVFLEDARPNPTH